MKLAGQVGILESSSASSKAYSAASRFICAFGLKVAIGQQFKRLNNFQQRSQLFVPSFYCGGAIGVAWRKLNVTHKFQKPGKLRTDTGHIQNAMGLDVDAI